MSEHTKEPWSIQNVEIGAAVTNDLCIMAPSPSFREIAQIARCYQGDRVKEMELANARRIVACVNACAGIPTDALECDTPTFIAMLQERHALRTHRDELLAALKQLDEAFCSNDYGTREGRDFGRKALIAARAAIAKAEAKS